MTCCVVIDGFLDSADVIHADACWPGPEWPWHDYGDAQGGKRVSDLTTPLPPFLSVLLARMACVNLGALLGMPDSVADLSLCGGGLHCLSRGVGLAVHLDADVHSRLGLMRAWSAALYVHASWGADWGGELQIDGRRIAPLPGRLVAFDARAMEHAVLPVRCPAGEQRRSLALFGYLPHPGEGRRPRALFDLPPLAEKFRGPTS